MPLDRPPVFKSVRARLPGMFDKLGIAGVVGVVLMLGGIAVVAWQNLILAGGLALVIAGLGLVVLGLVKNLLASFGMGGMV